MTDNLIDSLKDVFQLATGATAFVNELLKIKNTKNKLQQNDNGNSSQLAASGYSSQLAASGYSSKLAASGDYSQLAASGYSSKLAASGDYSQLAASGNSSKLAASGNSSQLAASGDYSQLAASGYSSKLAASGDSSQLAASGDSSQLAASGYSSQLAASGNSSQLAASGYSSQLAASGDSSQLAASGNSSKLAASGNSSQLESTGTSSVVAAIGYKNIAKAKKGSWITLAEYDNNGVISFVKTEQVDGERIKEDTFYTLYKKEFTEVEIIDKQPTIIFKAKNFVKKGLFLNSFNPCYVFTKDGVSAHGKTIKQAYRDWLFKTSPRDCSEYENLKLTDIKTLNEWAVCYRTITGACSGGTENFIECFKDKLKSKMTLQEVFNATYGQYGSNTFKEFFKRA